MTLGSEHGPIRKGGFHLSLRHGFIPAGMAERVGQGNHDASPSLVSFQYFTYHFVGYLLQDIGNISATFIIIILEERDYLRDLGGVVGHHD